VPTLRNVDLSPPYMHNGYFTSLSAVVEFYNDRDVRPRCRSALAEPPPARHELVAVITHVRDGTAERRETEAQEDEEHRPRTAAVVVGIGHAREARALNGRHAAARARTRRSTCA
jgi:cytochrome c peroxidase